MNVEQRQQFKDNGFLIVKDVLSPATVARLNATFVRLVCHQLFLLTTPLIPLTAHPYLW